MTNVTTAIHDRAKSQPRHIVLAEGLDPRVVTSAVKAIRNGLANITLIGNEDYVRPMTHASGDLDNVINIIDPAQSQQLTDFAVIYQSLNSKKYRDIDRAKSALLNPLNFANMLVREGFCDGSLAGAQNTSSDVIRSASHIIGPRTDHGIISSFFIMTFAPSHRTNRTPLIFADCAWVVSPTSEQLAEIAASTAFSAKELLNLDPKIALLSFSTQGSAKHPLVRKIEKAGDILAIQYPELLVESAIQFDAAIIESIGKLKAPGSDVAGHANILIFPNLEAGNIGYKIAERLGGATAIGPILQGLAKPANDLSRGCSADDIFNMIALTAVQSQSVKP